MHANADGMIGKRMTNFILRPWEKSIRGFTEVSRKGSRCRIFKGEELAERKIPIEADEG